MSTADPTLDLLAYHAFPHLASALRVRKDIILREWEKSVACTLPAADALGFGHCARHDIGSAFFHPGHGPASGDVEQDALAPLH